MDALAKFEEALNSTHIHNQYQSIEQNVRIESVNTHNPQQYDFES